MPRCSQCKITFTDRGSESTLCSYCFLFGADCEKCLIKNHCKKYGSLNISNV